MHYFCKWSRNKSCFQKRMVADPIPTEIFPFGQVFYLFVFVSICFLSICICIYLFSIYLYLYLFVFYLYLYLFVFYLFVRAFILGFTLCKTEQPLRGIEVQKKKKKKKQKIKAYRKSIQRNPTVKRCLLIVGLKPFRL